MTSTRKNELKDEIKSAISMNLQDPILQQGFEILCKESMQLVKAEGIISDLLNCLYSVEYPRAALEEAEKFLRRNND